MRWQAWISDKSVQIAAVPTVRAGAAAVCALCVFVTAYAALDTAVYIPAILSRMRSSASWVFSSVLNAVRRK